MKAKVEAKAKPKVPNAARAFAKQWVALFDARDWNNLTRLESGNGLGVGHHEAHAYYQELAKIGYRVASWDIHPYVQPKWSIFRLVDLHPPPAFWVDIFLDRGANKQHQIWQALAPLRGGGYETCAFVDKPKTKTARVFDLEKERARVTRFLGSSIRSFAKVKLVQPLESLELHYSREQGTLSISFDADPKAEPGRAGRMTHYQFKTLMVPAWADAFENASEIKTLEGRRLLRTKSGGFGAGRKARSFDDLVGGMLVAALKELRDAGGLRGLTVSRTASFGVEEIDGFFGWPRYQDRGKHNRFEAPRSGKRPALRRR